LHSTEATQVNLTEFARQAEVSQFQLLRAFKRRCVAALRWQKLRPPPTSSIKAIFIATFAASGA
jgi:hypothetical protein